MNTTAGLSLEDMPTTFALYQNFPNPFNPGTTIRFDLPDDSKVLLELFNILGQQVTTLISEKKKAGRYSVVFDATKYSSGVYFYRLFANGGVIGTKKMILFR